MVGTRLFRMAVVALGLMVPMGGARGDSPKTGHFESFGVQWEVPAPEVVYRWPIQYGYVATYEVRGLGDRSLAGLRVEVEPAKGKSLIFATDDVVKLLRGRIVPGTPKIGGEDSVKMTSTAASGRYRAQSVYVTVHNDLRYTFSALMSGKGDEAEVAAKGALNALVGTVTFVKPANPREMVLEELTPAFRFDNEVMIQLPTAMRAERGSEIGTTGKARRYVVMDYGTNTELLSLRLNGMKMAGARAEDEKSLALFAAAMKKGITSDDEPVISAAVNEPKLLVSQVLHGSQESGGGKERRAIVPTLAFLGADRQLGLTFMVGGKGEDEVAYLQLTQRMIDSIRVVPPPAPPEGQALAQASTTEGAQARPQTGGEGVKVWAPINVMEHHVFPSTIITMAAGRKPFSPTGVKFTNVTAGMKVRVELTCDALMEPSTAEVVVSKNAAEYVVPVAARWKYDELAKIHQQIPVTLTYRVTVNGQSAGSKADTAVVHSVNDCMYAMRKATGEWVPLFPLFASYVNSESPKLDKLLKDALATGIVNQFDGYQSRDPKQVAQQVLAIWHALQLRGMKYSSTADIAMRTDGVRAQHVRFPGETIESTQANCVDGSVALAAVLQKIGIETSLVVAPGHMFLAFYTQPGRRGMALLETTMMGEVDLPREAANATKDLLEAKWQAHVSTRSFAAAIHVGHEEYKELMEEEEKQKKEAKPKWVCEVVYVPDARREGFLPIPEVGGK